MEPQPSDVHDLDHPVEADRDDQAAGDAVILATSRVWAPFSVLDGEQGLVLGVVGAAAAGVGHLVPEQVVHQDAHGGNDDAHRDQEGLGLVAEEVVDGGQQHGLGDGRHAV